MAPAAAHAGLAAVTMTPVPRWAGTGLTPARLVWIALTAWRQRIIDLGLDPAGGGRSRQEKMMEPNQGGPGKYIDTVIETLYDSFSGPAGQKRDWDRLRALFIPGAQILRADIVEGGCSQSARMEIREFTASIEAFLEKKGYYGLEVLRRTEISGSLAKVLSVYEGRFDPRDNLPFRKGTGEIRLYHDGERWWIVNMLLREYREDDHDSRDSSS